MPRRGNPSVSGGKTVDEEAERQTVFLLATEIQRRATELAATANDLIEELERAREAAAGGHRPGASP